MLNEENKWDYAVGMLKADGLEPSPEMLELIEKERKGEITMDQIKEALDKMYKGKK